VHITADYLTISSETTKNHTCLSHILILVNVSHMIIFSSSHFSSSHFIMSHGAYFGKG